MSDLFTPKEIEVLKLRVGAGLCLKQVADRIRKSEKTADYHWRQICRKTDSFDALGVYRWMRGRGMIFEK